jgi:hypothetical protein
MERHGNDGTFRKILDGYAESQGQSPTGGYFCSVGQKTSIHHADSHALRNVVKGNGKGNYDSANSVSAIVAVRLVTSFNDRFKLHITPEYNIGLYKDDNCKMLSDFDSKFKSWTEGFNLNIGLMYFF